MVAPPAMSTSTSSNLPGTTPVSQLLATSQKPPAGVIQTAVAWTIVKLIVCVSAPSGLPARSVIAVRSMTNC